MSDQIQKGMKFLVIVCFLFAVDEFRAKQLSSSFVGAPPSSIILERISRNCTSNASSELQFFSLLIERRVPFSLLRIGDGEYAIAAGQNIASNQDHWKFDGGRGSLLSKHLGEALTYSGGNYFIGLPCLNWASKTNWFFERSNIKTGFLTTSLVFITSNYPSFLKWFDKYVVSGTVPTILIANEAVLENPPTWPLKIVGFPGNAVEQWGDNHSSWIQRVKELATSHNGTLFAVSLGPVAKVLIYEMWHANNLNMYVDFGSAMDSYVKGVNLRPYTDSSSPFSSTECEQLKRCSNNTVCIC